MSLPSALALAWGEFHTRGICTFTAWVLVMDPANTGPQRNGVLPPAAPLASGQDSPPGAALCCAQLGDVSAQSRTTQARNRNFSPACHFPGQAQNLPFPYGAKGPRAGKCPLPRALIWGIYPSIDVSGKAPPRHTHTHALTSVGAGSGPLVDNVTRCNICCCTHSFGREQGREALCVSRS